MHHNGSQQDNDIELERSADSWLKSMEPREPSEQNRGATPLELLFDLVFVVAISIASSQLHHGLSEHHVAEVLPLYIMVFFTIWWAWMNFTWFASAYDNDDIAYRLITFMQIIGSLVLAAGVNQVFTDHDFSVCVLGYLIMRFGLVMQWLRAGFADPKRRKTAFRYAKGIVLVQMGWIIYQLKLVTFTQLEFVALAFMEMCVPIWAEKANATTWHPEHMAERYGLLTIIVLGETIMASFTAIHTAIADPKISIDNQLICLTVGGMIMMFSVWWSYFARQAPEILTSSNKAFYWGYGHFFIFLSIAAIGAGLAAGVDVITGHSKISAQQAEYAIAIPLSIYSLVVWLIHDLQTDYGWYKLWHPMTVLLILLFPLWGNVGHVTLAIGIFYALCIVFRQVFLLRGKPSG
ncbi:low temperature requirement protein A [Alkanindiges hydrocarboniclasticus]|nr:low temperature requirement protein A [Alkanindiges hydrocarboniclasticus]